MSTFQIRQKRSKGKGTIKSDGKGSKAKGLFNLDISDDDEFENPNPDTLQDDLARYSKDIQAVESSLKASLAGCKCNNVLCIIDKHNNHYTVNALMLRTWVMALVSYLFYVRTHTH